MWLLWLIIVAAVGTIVWTQIKKAAKKSKFSQLENFDISDKYVAEDGNSAIAIDNVRRQICLLDHASNPSFYTFDSVYSVEIIQPIESKYKGSKTGAILGAALSGKKGALAGFTGAAKKSIKVKGIQMKIGVNDVDNPYRLINFLTHETKLNSFIYKMSAKEVRKWKDKLDFIIEDGKRSNKNKTSKGKTVSMNPKSISIVDEITKLNALKEKGAINENEFLELKQKLLQ